MLLPLVPFQSKLTIINNLICSAQGADLHGNYGVFTGTDFTTPSGQTKGQVPQGPSLDQYLGVKVGGNFRIPSLVLSDFSAQVGAFDSLAQEVRGFTYAGDTFTAAFGAGPSTPPTGGGGSSNPPSRANEMRASVLDYTANEIRAFRTQLAASERLKLDQYLNGIETLQKQLAPSTPGTGGMMPSAILCKTPTAPSLANLPTKGQTPLARGVFTTENCNAQIQVLAQAIVCGVTRFAFMEMNSRPSSLNRVFDPNNPNGNLFAYHHDAQHGGDMALRQEQNTYWIDRIAQLWRLLVAAPEGSGTVADNTLLVWMPGSGSHHGGTKNIPALILGDLGGAFRAGRHLRYAPDNGPSPQSVNNFFTSLCNLMGDPVPKFGDPKYCSGPLPNLV
jgi:hypothetical protein